MNELWEHKLLTARDLQQPLGDEADVSYGLPNEESLNNLAEDRWEICARTFSALSPDILIVIRRLIRPECIC